MAKTQVRSPQIGDGEVKRADLNVATAGSAVIAKLIQGAGIALSSTGADAGTGDVTVSVDDNAWSASTPTPASQGGSFTTASATLNYKKIGKIVFLRGSLTITNVGTATGRALIPLPFSPITSRAGFVTGWNETNLKMIQGVCSYDIFGDISLSTYDGLRPGTSGDTIYFSGFYECA